MTDGRSARERADLINALPDGWARAMGLRYVEATREALTAELVVGPQHLQPYGLVHGGVYAGIVEALASVGAALDVMPHGKSAVGLENHTSFVAACREGTLHARATPVARGSRTQVWEVAITDATNRLLATGRVRLLILDAASAVAGGSLAIRDE
jgi:1,4-dihydroxy-2-naphthoyl-CoA hydrolase